MGILLLHMTTSPKSRTDGFFDEWSIYDEVLACNAMRHDEIFADVRRFLAGCYGDRSFAILDLGCGSARHLARAVKGRSLSAYVGYDLSDTALTHAKRNLADLGCPVDLRNGDLIEGVRNFRDRCDVIFSSFALHHLTSVRKMEFFASAYRRLKRDGICLVIDTMRDEGEDLSTYLDRYCAWLRKRCPSLPEEVVKTS